MGCILKGFIEKSLYCYYRSYRGFC